jgi:hypothetical protein
VHPGTGIGTLDGLPLRVVRDLASSVGLTDADAQRLSSDHTASDLRLHTDGTRTAQVMTRGWAANASTAVTPNAEIAELTTMLVRYRTQAVATVTATLAASIESNIESLVSRIVADYELSARRRKIN